MDKDAILPAVNKATRQKVPVVAYDRLIEAPGVFYITFDNVEVGRMQARAVLQGEAQGQLRLHQGLAHRPERQLPARRPAGGAGRRGEEGRHQDRRRRVHRRLEARGRAEEHGADPHQERQQGRCGGGVQRRHRRRRGGGAHAPRASAASRCRARTRDFAALNRVALGTQTVSVWKDSRELGREAASAAVALAAGQEGRRRRANWSGGEKKLAISLASCSSRCRSRATTSTWSSRPAGSRRTSSARASTADKAPAACK